MLEIVDAGTRILAAIEPKSIKSVSETLSSLGRRESVLLQLSNVP